MIEDMTRKCFNVCVCLTYDSVNLEELRVGAPGKSSDLHAITFVN